MILIIIGLEILIDQMGNLCCSNDSNSDLYYHKDIVQRHLVFIDFPDIEHDEIHPNQDAEIIHPCIICYERESCALLLPCKHSKLCDSCALYFKEKRQCPICKAKINKAVRIF